MDEPGPSLVRLRLHWYAHATARLLLRRWQAIVLTLAVIAPAGVPPKALLSMLAAPVSYLLVPDVAFFFRLSVFLLLVGSSMLWVLIQRDAILGGRFSNFVESLPLSAKSILLADLLLLVVADSPLWSFLLVCSAFPHAPNSLATWTSVDYLIRSAWLILFSGTVIAAQLAILRTRSEKLLFCALAAILLCSVVSVPGAVLRSILIAGTALMVVLALQVSGWPGTTKRPKWRIQPHDRRTQSRSGYAPAPIMLHSLRLLVR